MRDSLKRPNEVAYLKENNLGEGEFALNVLDRVVYRIDSVESDPIEVTAWYFDDPHFEVQNPYEKTIPIVEFTEMLEDGLILWVDKSAVFNPEPIMEQFAKAQVDEIVDSLGRTHPYRGLPGANRVVDLEVAFHFWEQFDQPERS